MVDRLTPDERKRTSRPADERRPTHEPRWPVVITLLFLLAVLLGMPERLQLLPDWALCLLTVLAVAPLVAVAMRPASRLLKTVERITLLGVVVFAAIANLTVLRSLVLDILRNAQAVSGIQLLASSVAIWAANVVTFSVFYWEIDRGGPAARERPASGPPDWAFAEDQVGAEVMGPGWKPIFVDYLFLGFSTATAFSTTDTLPLTRRAKLAMMAESAISLLIMVVVAARAINVLA